VEWLPADGSVLIWSGVRAVAHSLDAELDLVQAVNQPRLPTRRPVVGQTAQLLGSFRWSGTAPALKSLGKVSAY
jgi:hypothetical protein